MLILKIYTSTTNHYMKKQTMQSVTDILFIQALHIIIEFTNQLFVWQ